MAGAAGGQARSKRHFSLKKGAKLIARGLDSALLAETVAEINQELGTDSVIGLSHNIATEGEWNDVLATTLEAFGAVGVLINNAAIPEAGADIGIEGNFSFGLVAELEGRAALDAFSSDPRHIDIAMSILEFRRAEDIAIVDYTI